MTCDHGSVWAEELDAARARVFIFVDALPPLVLHVHRDLLSLVACLSERKRILYITFDRQPPSASVVSIFPCYLQTAVERSLCRVLTQESRLAVLGEEELEMTSLNYLPFVT